MERRQSSSLASTSSSQGLFGEVNPSYVTTPGSSCQFSNLQYRPRGLQLHVAGRLHVCLPVSRLWLAAKSLVKAAQHVLTPWALDAGTRGQGQAEGAAVCLQAQVRTGRVHSAGGPVLAVDGLDEPVREQGRAWVGAQAGAGQRQPREL